jgi:hypothetical protein
MTGTRSLQLYVGMVGLAALSLIAGFLRAESLFVIPPENVVILVVGIGAMMAAGSCPICVGPKVAVSMAGTVIFAMLLLLPAPLAALGTALGIGLLYTLMRWPTLYVVFNVAQSTITVIAASAALSLTGAPPAFTQFGAREIAAAGAAAGVFFFINSVIVTQFAVLHGGTSFLTHWKHAFGRSIVPYLSTLLVGLVVAVTYVHAPMVTPILVLPTVAIYRALRDASVLQRQTRETVEFLADIMDRRDRYTFEHSHRVAALAKKITGRLGLPEEEQEAVAQAARVHDLGKLGISDGLLFKPERLSPHELEEIRKHSVIGAEIVGKLPQYARGKEYILFHHERYDGSGAFRLYGTHIPIGARVIAVADAFDAMTSDRPYRSALSVEDALAEITKGGGTQFDPVVAQALVAIVHEESAQVTSPADAAPTAVATQPTLS